MTKNPSGKPELKTRLSENQPQLITTVYSTYYILQNADKSAVIISLHYSSNRQQKQNHPLCTVSFYKAISPPEKIPSVLHFNKKSFRCLLLAFFLLYPWLRIFPQKSCSGDMDGVFFIWGFHFILRFFYTIFALDRDRWVFVLLFSPALFRFEAVTFQGRILFSNNSILKLVSVRESFLNHCFRSHCSGFGMKLFWIQNCFMYGLNDKWVL